MAPDAHGLTLLPLLSGERGPGWSDRAGAAIEGLTIATTPLDLLRAGLEAVALRFALLDAELPGDHTSSPPAAGSINSPAWTQIVADALGRPVAHSASPRARAAAPPCSRSRRWASSPARRRWARPSSPTPPPPRPTAPRSSASRRSTSA